ncbi:MAG: hypothetical protein LUF30_09000 [Lachnospiraceae bacterium]|nr:hypothetical protein [Lachnospiraceae bacterium]
MAQYVLTAAVLLACTYTDIRQRKIYKGVIGVYLVLALAFHLWMKNLLSFDTAVGVLSGFLFLLVASATTQAIGYVYAFLIIGCGFSLGIEQELALLLTAFTVAGIWAILLLVFRRGKRDSEIPFAPFLLIGVIVQGLGGIVQ